MPKLPTPPARPMIGITTDFYTPKTGTPYTRLNLGYIDAVVEVGGLPLLIPPLRKDNFAEVDSYLKMCSGIILSGGMDLDPRGYGQQPTAAVQPMSPRREACEKYLFTKVAEMKMPVLGIGAGMQLINIHHGGTLFVHLPAENPKAFPHCDPSGGAHRHMVNVEPRSFLEEIYGPGEQRVNSMHHQAVNQLGRRLRVSARSHDGVIEAIETTDRDWFCVGLQWHPECDTASALDRQIFDCFVTAAGKHVTAPVRQTQLRIAA
jgi:putative glutamine amidotransferase